MILAASQSLLETLVIVVLHLVNQVLRFAPKALLDARIDSTVSPVPIVILVILRIASVNAPVPIFPNLQTHIDAAALNIGSIQLPVVLKLDSTLAGVLQGTLVLFVLLSDGLRQRLIKK